MSGGRMVKLGELGRFLKGKGLPKADLVEDGSEGTPCLRYAEIYTTYDDTTATLLSRATVEGARNAAELLKEDIVFAASGETAEEIGKAVGYLGDDAAVVGGDTVIFRGHGQDTRYLSAVLNSHPVAIQKASRGKGYSVVHIHAQELSDLEFWLHDRKQQERVATVLDAWNDAIILTQRLQNRKASRRRRLLDQLISDFGATMPLSQLARMNRHSLKASTPSDFKFEYFAIGGDEEDDEAGWMTFAESPSRARRLAATGDVIYSTVRPMLRRIFRAPAHDSAVYSTGYAVIEPKQRSDGSFIFHAMTSKLVERQVFGRLTGSNYPAIAASDLATIQLPQLSAPKRQEIGELLDAMAEEEKYLSRLFQRYTTQKRGLMQKLLTGEWPIPESIDRLMPGSDAVIALTRKATAA